MIWNYFKIAWRNLWKNKLFSIINVVSLAIGLSASFVIGLMVYHEFTFDKFHEDVDQIYRVTTEYTSPDDKFYNSGVASPLRGTLKEGVPGVEITSAFFTSDPATVKVLESGIRHKNLENVIYADENYFKLFSYNWIAGNSNSLGEPNEVVLTEERAKKYFPDLAAEQVIGKILVYNDSINAEVTGIVENFEKRTDLIFEEFISLETAQQTDFKDQVFNDSWGSTTSASQLFIKVADNAKIQNIQKRLDEIAREHEDENAYKYQEYRYFKLQPMRDLLVGRQIHYLMNKDMGFRTEAIAYVQTPWKDQSMDKRKRFLREIKEIPQVTKASLGGFTPASGSINATVTNYFDGEREIRTELQLLHGDSTYLDLYDIDLLAGRNLRNNTVREFIINETYAKQLGFEDPNKVVGEFLKYGETAYPIVGVMEDFHQRSLKSPIVPMALIGDWNSRRYSSLNAIHFSLKTDSDWAAILAKAEKIWKNTYPDADFEVKFMDETIQEFYTRERSTAKLLNWATGLSVLISCLGLLGLVIYTTERRRKEIGIRKVLGATLVQLNLLLCRDFMLLVGLAFLVAAPIAWWGLHNWLQDFAYRTSLSWWIFALSGAAMLFISLLIMSIRTLKTAMSNPVESLKTE